jgi:putative acetyltransferase
LERDASGDGIPTIRPMAIEDHAAVLELWEATDGVGLGDSDTRPAIASYLERNRGLSLVTVVEGAIVGAVLCGHDGRRGYIHHLAVAMPHRGRGHGRALVDACLDGLHADGIAKCTIVVYADNAEGGAFWTRVGWAERDDLRIMQRAIDPAG